MGKGGDRLGAVADELLGGLDAEIARAEGFLMVLRGLRSEFAAALGVYPPVRRACPTRAERIAAALDVYGVPVKIPTLIDALRGAGGLPPGASRDKSFDLIRTALSRTKAADGSPRFAQVAPGTWWFAGR